MKPEIKKWIDSASYEEMLQKTRFAPAGDEFFVQGNGVYFAKVMAKKKEKLADGEHVTISKRIGWKHASYN